MIKQIFCWVGLIACLLFVGCNKDRKQLMQQPGKDPNKISVLATTAMIGDLVREIGKEHVQCIELVKGEIDPHSYELVKGDDEKIKEADLIFSNGLGLEHGASLRYSLLEHPRATPLGEEVKRKYPEKILMVSGQVDPHIWMDISLWVHVVDPIATTLSNLDPAHREEYESNARILKEKMEKTDLVIRQKMSQIPAEKRFLVTSHDAFHYFSRAYLSEKDQWKERCAAPEGLAPDGQLSSADIQRIIDHLCKYQISVVFPESNLNRDSLRKIVSACAEKGLKVEIAKEPLYGDAMGGPDSGADTYLNMIQRNVAIMEKYWNSNSQ